MTPLQFEQAYDPEWQELEDLLKQVRRAAWRRRNTQISGARIAQLYRRACEQLSLARARAYPAHTIDRLSLLTDEAHQFIYQQHDVGAAGFFTLWSQDFPRAVRAHAAYVWWSTALFFVPALVLGLLVYFRPEMILSIVDADTAANFEQMYSQAAKSVGRLRTADTDWTMFGFYIRNNITIAFQCFAGGLFVGLGSIFFVAFNGAQGGAVAGYLSQIGLQQSFFSFVVTHAAFELTAIILAGAAGLRLGHSILAPGRLSRLQSLVVAARESVVIVYGVTAMLTIAAVIEAFWSSAGSIAPLAKFAAGAVCWIAVIAYLCLQGRRAG